MRFADEDGHKRQVAEHRDESVGKMEAGELSEGGAVAVAPCAAQVPEEIMEQRHFDSSGGCDKKVASGYPVEDGKCGELNNHSDRPDEVEPAPPLQSTHGSGSCR